jgi:hypothetical protein
MTKAETKKAICSYLDIADTTTVRMVYAMLKEHSVPTDDSEELYQEMERRRKAYDQGEVKSSTVAEAMVRLRKSKSRKK